MVKLNWAIDGHGTRHYFCDWCGLIFGAVDPDTIVHECDETRERGFNWGVFWNVGGEG